MDAQAIAAMVPQVIPTQVGFVGVPPGTPTIALGDGRTVQVADYVDDKHYSTAELQAGDTSLLDVFVASRGSPIPGGTRALNHDDCNLPRAGNQGLPPAWEFYVYSLTVEVVRAMRLNNPGTASQGMGDPVVTGETFPSVDSYSNIPTAETLFQLNRRLFFEYKYASRTQVEGAINTFPGGVGMSITTTRTFGEYAFNGRVSPHDKVILTLPIEEKQDLLYNGFLSPESALRIGQNAADESTTLSYVDVKVSKYGIIRKNV